VLDRKEQILDVAGELLQTRSFTSFSYQDLSDRIGISKASIHHHFPSKEELGKALVVRNRDIYLQKLEDIAGKYHTPWDKFEAYLALVGDVVKSGNKICPVGALQVEHNVISQDMREELHRVCRAVQAWVAGVVAEGRKKGVMDFPGTAEDQAALIHSAIQGALQNARADGPKQFTAVMRQLRAGMKVRQ